jgi:hypothetical protein
MVRNILLFNRHLTEKQIGNKNLITGIAVFQSGKPTLSSIASHLGSS